MLSIVQLPSGVVLVTDGNKSTQALQHSEWQDATTGQPKEGWATFPWQLDHEAPVGDYATIATQVESIIAA